MPAHRWQKGREKTGGRKKGTPNKSSLAEVTKLLKQEGVNPLRRAIHIAKTTDNEKLQAHIWLTVCKYRYQELKAVEVSGDPEHPVYVADADARRQRIDELLAKRENVAPIIVVDAE